MNSLPGLVVLLVFSTTCLAHDAHMPALGVAKIVGPLSCPGICQTEESCRTSLSDTNCTDGLKCCVDHLENIASTEFADPDLTTESLLDSNVVHEIDDQISEDPDTGVEMEEDSYGDDEDMSDYYDGELNDEQYAYLYSDDSSVSNATEVNIGVDEEVTIIGDPLCYGLCVTAHEVNECAYIMNERTDCIEGYICCLSQEDFERNERFLSHENLISKAITKRSAEPVPQYDCPGSCMHPSHMIYCQQVLNQFSCPLNSKCCTLPMTRVVPVPEPVECTGSCLPNHMEGYCLPPNELVMGPTTCEYSTTCCMINPANIKPPQVKAMSFPSGQSPYNEATANLLGHLAVDDNGNVFKVSKNGHISPLHNIPVGTDIRGLIRLATYPRYNGDIAIYSSPSGELYQMFVLRNPMTPNLQPHPIRHPAQKQKQVAEQTDSFHGNLPVVNNPTSDEQSEQQSDIVIPDDDDEAPVTTNTPVVHTDKHSRPSCPGSCMSYFLRFTCFRGYAIYDGFTCPGRQVCCARLSDIEEHEQYLKSLTPYFNAPPVSRGSGLPRCGIKGRRDTPRVMGGKDALPGEWCWQVAVINVQNQYICGGALIDNSWVLTAAHCVASSVEEGQAIFVRAGVTDLKSPEDNRMAQTIRVLTTFVHHNFNSKNLDNNIALLRLQKPVELNEDVCVICLPTSRQMPEEGVKCTVTGYGFVSPEGGMSLKIREAKVPISDDMECMTNVTEALESPFILPASSFCAGGEGIEDACQGDAGGALACEAGGFHELVGLVSWGLGCGKNFVPSIYVKVPAFMGWINQIISSSSFVLP